MGKFTHLNENEIVSHIEKFGTEDERDLVNKLHSPPNYDECPDCDIYQEHQDGMDTTIDVLNEKITNAIAILEEE